MTRWLIRLVAAALAVVTIFAEIDRASVRRPQLALFVPRSFRSFAQYPIALTALAQNDPVAAEREAKRLVRVRPVPAEHLFALATADLRNRKPQAFVADFRAASTRGWRFAPLQVAAAQAALANGDLPGTANRVAALWAAEPDDPEVRPLTTALLGAPGGPEAFAVPLSQTQVWSGNFLAAAASLAPPPAVVRTVQAAERNGARFDCEAVRSLARQLAATGQNGMTASFACKQ